LRLLRVEEGKMGAAIVNHHLAAFYIWVVADKVQGWTDWCMDIWRRGRDR
jgi:hypothetical protein